MEIEFTAKDDLQKVLSSIGQTEDVKLSPDNRRLAIAGFTTNKLLIIDIEIKVSSTETLVTLIDFMEITSPSLKEPHGLFFIDNETLIVANRGGDVPILRLPPIGTEGKVLALSALNTIYCNPTHQLKTSDAVSVSQIDQDLYEVLICNTFVHYVTRHILDGRKDFRIISSEILLKKRLNLPDGIAVNHDRRWIAISNHNTHSVFLYENTPQLNQHSEPTAILGNVNYPHGVRFSSDNEFILVADAGSPFVHVYAKRGSSWKGMRKPVTLIRVMDQDTFLRGQHNSEEGGAKGIDITDDMNVLVSTCEKKPIAFFDLRKILKEQRLDKPAPLWLRYVNIAPVMYQIYAWNFTSMWYRVAPEWRSIQYKSLNSHIQTFIRHAALYVLTKVSVHGSFKYQLGEELSFGIRGNADRYLLSGYYHPEKWGRWIIGTMANVILPLAVPINSDLQLELEINPFLHPPEHPICDFAVQVNGVVLLNVYETRPIPNRYTVTIPKTHYSDVNLLVISVIAKSTARPVDLGINNDSRLIGVGLVSLRLSAVANS